MNRRSFFTVTVALSLVGMALLLALWSRPSYEPPKGNATSPTSRSTRHELPPDLNPEEDEIAAQPGEPRDSIEGSDPAVLLAGDASRRIQVRARSADVLKEWNGAYGFESSFYRVTLEKGRITVAGGAVTKTGQPGLLSYSLEEVRVGGKPLEIRKDALPKAVAGTRLVTYEHGSVEERYTLKRSALEQDIVIRELPAGRGEIVVSGTVTTNLQEPADRTRASRLSFRAGDILDTYLSPAPDSHGFNPRISYSAPADKFLVIWMAAPVSFGSQTAIMGRILNGSATPATEPFSVSPDATTGAFEASLVADGTGRWLVAYATNFGTNYLKWVSSIGQVTQAVAFPKIGIMPRAPQLALQNNLFLLVWLEQNNPDNFYFARLMDSNGVFVSPTATVDTYPMPGGSLDISVLGAAGKFTVTWIDYPTQTLKGRFIEATASSPVNFLTPAFNVNVPPVSPLDLSFTLSPHIAYCPTSSEWMSVFVNRVGPGDDDIYLHRFNAAGSVTLTDRISQEPLANSHPRIAWNSSLNEMLVVYATWGGSSVSNVIYAQRYAPAQLPPSMPTSVIATPASNQVSLSWSASPGAATYSVKRATATGGPYTTIAQSLSGTSFVDTMAANETTYFFVVSASSSGGESSNSKQVQATPRLPSPQALLVVGNSVLGIGDAAVESRLRGLGFTTVMREAGTSKTSDAGGKALVMISSTITSSGVNTKFKNVAVPVINWENALHDDFGMTALVSATDFGTQGGQTSVAILNPTHPLAAGFSGSVSVTGTNQVLSWGVPGPAATVAATLTGNAGRAVIFGYEAGASMPGLAAPARRVGFFLDDLTASALTAQGFLLIDAAVQWAIGGTVGAPLPPSGLTASASAGQVSLAWTASSGAASYTVLRSAQQGGSYVPVQTGVVGTTFIDLGLQNGQTYYYRVVAVNGSGTSGPANEAFATPQIVAPPVLFVVGNTVLGAGDALIRTRLEALGFSVIVKDGPSSASSDAQGTALIVVSSTVTSTTVGMKFRTSTVPVLNWENALYDDFGMTGFYVGTEFGTQTGQTSVEITNAAHPLAAGLSGTVAVTDTASIFSWGTASSEAVVAGTMPGISFRALSFGYEVGATMPGLTAPARRAGLFLEDLTATTLSASGWKLFDAAVRWASDLNPGAPPVPTGLSATAGNGQVGLTWAPVPGATSYRVKRATTTGAFHATVATVPGTAFVDVSVQNSTTYYYVVSALAGTAESVNSSEALSTPGSPVRQGLLVVLTDAPLGPGDATVKARLEGLGFSVTVKTGANSATADATGKQLVILSSTVTSSTVGQKFRNVAVPVLNWENALYDDLGMTGLSSTDYGTVPGQSTVLTINPGHPLAAGLSGTVAVTTQVQTFAWGIPNGNAVIAASLAGSSHSVIFGYETGAAMPGLVAPARRVGFFLEDLTAASLHPNGLALFDAAVRWALGLAAPGTPPAAPTGLIAVGGNANVTLDWDDNSESDLAGYNVYRAPSFGGPYAGPINASPINSSSYLDSPLPALSTRYYVVRAVTTGGQESESTTTASATMLQEVLTRPVVTTPASASTVTTSTPTIGGTSNVAGLKIDVYVDNIFQVETTSGLNGNWSITQPFPLTDGQHAIHVVARSSSAVSDQSFHSLFIIDTPAAPTGSVSIQGTSPNAVSKHNSGALYVATVTTNSNFFVYLQVLLNGLEKYRSSDYISTVGPGSEFTSAITDMDQWGLQAGDTLIFRGLVMVPGVAAGTHDLTVVVSASQGDQAAPVVSLLSPGHQSEVSIQRPQLSASVTDIGGSGIAQGSVKVVLNGRVLDGVAVIVVGTDAMVSVIPSFNLPEGMNGYSVYAEDNAGNGASSQTFYFLVDSITQPLPTPTLLTAEPGDSQVTLTWSASTGADHYFIARSDPAGGLPDVFFRTSDSSTVYSDKGLNNGSAYYYRVQAIGFNAKSTFSNELVATPAPAASHHALLVVGNLTLSSGDDSIKSLLEAMGYVVALALDSNATSGQANQKSIVVISSSSDAALLGGAFLAVPTPVMVLDDEVMVALGLTSASSADHGILLGQTVLDISNAAHQMAAELSGTVTTGSPLDPPSTVQHDLYVFGRTFLRANQKNDNPASPTTWNRGRYYINPTREGVGADLKAGSATLAASHPSVAKGKVVDPSGILSVSDSEKLWDIEFLQDMPAFKEGGERGPSFSYLAKLRVGEANTECLPPTFTIASQDRITLGLHFHFPEVLGDHSLEFSFPGEPDLYNQKPGEEWKRTAARQRVARKYLEATSKTFNNPGWIEPNWNGTPIIQGALDQANVAFYSTINDSPYGVLDEAIDKGAYRNFAKGKAIPNGMMDLATSPLYNIAKRFSENKSAINVVFVKAIEAVVGGSFPLDFQNVVFIAEGNSHPAETLSHEIAHCLGVFEHTQEDRKAGHPIERTARINNPQPLVSPRLLSAARMRAMDTHNLMSKGDETIGSTYLTDVQCRTIWDAAKSHPARRVRSDGKDYWPD